MFERFSEAARQVVVRARQEALHRGDNFIGAQHVLLGLLQCADERGALTLLRRRGCQVEAVRAALLAQIDPGSGRAAG